MPGLIYTRAEVISLKSHPDYAEKWVRDRLTEDPSMLGLGPLVIRDVERTQPRTGRLDLLFSDPLDRRCYEVELMLGPMDESHVIRGIEYWDTERKRTPQYEHCAVLVAEQIGARFMNVLGLFAPHIPIIAVQMIALRVNEYLALQFFRVMGDASNEERSFSESGPWIERRARVPDGPNHGPALVDACLGIIHAIDPTITLDHRRDMIALARGEQRTEALSFFPHRDFLGVKARAIHKQDWLARLESAGIVVLSGGPLRKRTHFRLTLEQLHTHHDLLREFFELCLREQGFVS